MKFEILWNEGSPRKGGYRGNKEGFSFKNQSRIQDAKQKREDQRALSPRNDYMVWISWVVGWKKVDIVEGMMWSDVLFIIGENLKWSETKFRKLECNSDTIDVYTIEIWENIAWKVETICYIFSSVKRLIFFFRKKMLTLFKNWRNLIEWNEFVLQTL